MEIFYLTLRQMLMMFALMLVGYVLRKKSILPENSNVVMARLETYAFVPALVLYTQMTKCTLKSFTENSIILLYGAITILVAVVISYPLSKIFVKNPLKTSELSYQKNIYKYALTFGNFGFMGNFIILGVWGSDFFYKYSLFTFVLSLVCYSWGMCVLIPKDKNLNMLANLKKGLLTPPIIALVIGVIMGLTGVAKYVPDFVISALDNAGKCQGPVAMVLAGFVVGGYNFKELILNKKVYLVTIFRLVLIPAAMVLVLKALGTSEEILIPVLIAFATPLGLNTIVYPAAYGGDTKTGAAMAMVSHTLSVITIPLMYLVLMVLL